MVFVLINSLFYAKAGTECPAGEYQFTHQKGTIEMKGGEGQIHLSLPVITFIARSPGTSGHLLAFDKVGQGRILSEIWLPGAQGALVNAARGEHEHDVVRLNRKGQR